MRACEASLELFDIFTQFPTYNINLKEGNLHLVIDFILSNANSPGEENSCGIKVCKCAKTSFDTTAHNSTRYREARAWEASRTEY